MRKIWDSFMIVVESVIWHNFLLFFINTRFTIPWPRKKKNPFTTTEGHSYIHTLTFSDPTRFFAMHFFLQAPGLWRKKNIRNSYETSYHISSDREGFFLCHRTKFTYTSTNSIGFWNTYTWLINKKNGPHCLTLFD